MGGFARLWQDLRGSSRIWKDLGGSERIWEVLARSGRYLRGLEKMQCSRSVACSSSILDRGRVRAKVADLFGELGAAVQASRQAGEI